MANSVKEGLKKACHKAAEVAEKVVHGVKERAGKAADWVKGKFHKGQDNSQEVPLQASDKEKEAGRQSPPGDYQGW
jgi:hypothetical protein